VNRSPAPQAVGWHSRQRERPQLKTSGPLKSRCSATGPGMARIRSLPSREIVALNVVMLDETEPNDPRVSGYEREYHCARCKERPQFYLRQCPIC
jgi:hypothetical protein